VAARRARDCFTNWWLLLAALQLDRGGVFGGPIARASARRRVIGMARLKAHAGRTEKGAPRCRNLRAGQSWRRPVIAGGETAKIDREGPGAGLGADRRIRRLRGPARHGAILLGGNS